ncbi:MAG: Thrombospondin type 3 repeat [Deltaproteobacteria bacterium]|nr:Thrombospondin type 3 repeat [Deltaproteobacteria bacterium]
MNRAVLVTLLLAGCGEVQLGGPCDQPADCPDAVCDLTDPAGGTCISKAGDLDGDGIPNTLDFCNHQPGGDLDDDRDGIGDVCDRCPTAPPPAKPDSDGDEVDSPCDPDPDVGGDRIAVFESFNNGLPAGWTASAGWQFVAGEAIATPADPTVVEKLTTPLPLISQHLAILGQYRIDATNPQASQNFAGVIGNDRRPAGGSSVQCTGTRTGGTDTLVLDTGITTGTKLFGNLFDSASLYQVTVQLDLAQAACAMIADTEIGAVQATGPGEALTEAGLLARGATARFQYLLVVQRAP